MPTIYLHNHNGVLDLRGRSTLSQLVLAKSNLVDCSNIRACINTIYTDLSKAFDSISYDKLLVKMHGYGGNPSVCEWVRDFLTDRQQRVAINNCKSNWLH